MNKKELIMKLEDRYQGTRFGIKENEYFTFVIYDNSDIYNNHKESFFYDIIGYLEPQLTEEQKHRLIIKYDLLGELKNPKENLILTLNSFEELDIQNCSDNESFMFEEEKTSNRQEKIILEKESIYDFGDIKEYLNNIPKKYIDFVDNIKWNRGKKFEDLYVNSSYNIDDIIIAEDTVEYIV